MVPDVLLLFALLAHPGAIGAAEAHPERAGLGHRVDLRVAEAGPDGRFPLTLDYVVEIPGLRLYQEAAAANDPQYPEHLAASLADAVGLSWDGQSLPLGTDPTSFRAEEGERGFVNLHLRRTGALPGPAGRVQILNRALAADDALFATWVQLPGSLVVVESSLVEVRDGRLRNNHHGAWSRKAADREPTFTLRAAGLFERRPGSFTLAERMAGQEALAPPGWLWPAVAGGGAALLGLVVLLLRRRRG